ncbi:MAG: hypothetical protein IKB38_10510 [Clostridia bacterium]|nr:hypothetical protein [Clostridia bacterium]
MDFVSTELERRGVPSALVSNRGIEVKTEKQMQKRREELKKILAENEYGTLPSRPEHLRVEKKPGIPNFCAGKVTSESLDFVCTVDGVEFSFPVRSAIPKSDKKVPAFVHINFSANTPDHFQPTEEITDRGFAVFSFCHSDVTADNGDFKDKCAAYLGPSRRKKNASGKIMMWAWAAMRVMDYIETLPEIDAENVAVIGHSRLGKTALVTAAFDERFKYAVSNDSGCSGAAISRGKTGESTERITQSFPFWFCPRYKDDAEAQSKCFDQNYLTALIPPRHLLVGSAEDDAWADPKSEFLGCASANSVYGIYGMKGLVYGEDYPEAKTVLADGDSFYHVRKGPHFLSREDWNVYMDFIESKMSGR